MVASVGGLLDLALAGGELVRLNDLLRKRDGLKHFGLDLHVGVVDLGAEEGHLQVVLAAARVIFGDDLNGVHRVVAELELRTALRDRRVEAEADVIGREAVVRALHDLKVGVERRAVERGVA